MVDKVKLYINDQLVEFSTDPAVLWTYQYEDMSNPTAVKNGFTKTITIEGTPTNNDIFGHYWNVERYLLNGGEGGAYYNSSKKAPFQLFLGSDLYEDGYAKLDSIDKTGSKILYKVTLYGGLGDFFQNLSATDDGTEKRLSDLTYINGNDEFDFVANIDTVNTAWNALKNGTSGKWQYINFAPSYNGYPDDFDANKVVMNLSGTTLRTSVKNADDENKWYSVKQGWTIGTLPEDMTEWEVRDLRSYLQRPCIRMKEVINACCNPINNGGYTVNLDSDFFDSTNDYWEKTWLTLPMIQSLENDNEQQILTGATLSKVATTGDTSGLMYQELKFDLGEIQANVSSIEVDAQIAVHTIKSKSSYVWFWNYNGDSYHTGWWCLGSLFCQLIALNGDVVVGASDVYNLTTPVRHNGKLWYGHNGHYPDSTGIDSSTGRQKMGNGSKYIPYMDKPIYNVLGDLDYYGFKREGENSAATFNFRIDNIGSTVTGLKMVYYWGATANKTKHFSPAYVFENTYGNGWLENEYSAENVPMSSIVLTILDHNINAVMGESLGRTGTKVTKSLLLATESSPCDYLLSYAKMFGLHFVKHPGEKVIDVMTRKTFYDRNTVVDLNDYIDHGKSMTTNPLMFSSKWYEFLQEKDESQLQQKYLTAKGVEYGEKILNTGYEFDTEKKNLLDDNSIKSGIECLEKSKWFTCYNNDSSLRPWMNLGLKYTVWYGDSSMETDAGSYQSQGSILPLNEGQGLKYYDLFPKLQFHGDDNSPCDGNNCLVFFSGFKNVSSGRSNPLSYILSDDTGWQTELNDGTPCWLFTNQEYWNNKRMCYKLTELPVFERYLTGAESGTIMKSLDFGSAQELYIPNYTLTDDTNIYYNYWRTYMTDLFDVNTRKMTCFIRVLGKPNPEWFRRFYWFDNAIWSLNKLTDWNPASYDTCKAEFIKVQDIDDYSSISQVLTGTIELSANVYSVHYTGGTVTITVTTDPGVSWRLGVEGGSIVSLSSSSGTGTGSVTATFSANPEEYQVGAYFTATRNDNAYAARMYVHQASEGDQEVKAIPTDLIFDYSGGTQEVLFQWYNQGTSYIDNVRYDEGEDSLYFTADLTTKKTQNIAIIGTTARTNSVVTAGTGTTVVEILHNYCTFDSDTSDAYCSIGIDQLPEAVIYPYTGGTVVMSFQWADEVSFIDLPYWISAVDNLNGTYNIVAADNPTSDMRIGSVTVSVGQSSAAFNVRQDVDDIFKVTRTDGTGNILATGQTASLHVDSITGWTVTTSADYVSMSITGSTGSDNMTVDFDDNTGETRQAVLVFTNSASETITYTLTQEGTMSHNQNVVSPTILVFNATGETKQLTVSIPNSWEVIGSPAWISCAPVSGTTSSTVNVTAEPNPINGGQRQGLVVINDTVSGQAYVVTCLQDPAESEMIVVLPNSVVFTKTGGTATFTIYSNVDWTIE